MGRPINTKSKRRSTIRTKKPISSEKTTKNESVKSSTAVSNTVISNNHSVENYTKTANANDLNKKEEAKAVAIKINRDGGRVITSEPHSKYQKKHYPDKQCTRRPDNGYKKNNRITDRYEKKKKPGGGANVIVHGKFIIALLKSSIDTDVYKYTINENFGRAEHGTATVTCNIALKSDPSNSCTITVILSKDVPTKLVHISILDITNNIAPVYLFSVLSKDPRRKMERYIPTIIVSTQDKIK